MRSVYSGAGAVALTQLGMKDVFDEVYATSAGAMNASYFISNQALLGMTVYFENCTTKTFVNPLRVWKVLDVDYIIDTVSGIGKRLDTDALTSSSTQLLISVCDQRTGEVILVDTRSTQTELLQVLKAAMAIPVYYNRAVDVDGCRCIDSGTVLPFPMTHPIDRDCTDILVLLTRPASFVETRPSWMKQRVFDLVHARGRKSLSDAYSNRHVRSQLVRDLALGRIAPPPGVNIAAICPDDGLLTGNTTTSPAVTFSAAVQYGRLTMKAFGHDPNEFDLPPPQSMTKHV
jgi:predicted patatin/cPLA2 family phospholipase